MRISGVRSARCNDEIAADLRADHADVLVEVVVLHHHGQASHVLVEQRGHAQDFARGVIDEKAVVACMAVDIGEVRCLAICRPSIQSSIPAKP